MEQPYNKGRDPLPDYVIDAAFAGDTEAIGCVLLYYDSYMNKLCTRTLYGADGQPRVRVDEYMKRRLQIKLIHTIAATD